MLTDNSVNWELQYIQTGYFCSLVSPQNFVPLQEVVLPPFCYEGKVSWKCDKCIVHETITGGQRPQINILINFFLLTVTFSSFRILNQVI